jgi:Uma2 family endonuclease
MEGERVVLTYEDYESLAADGRRYEIHDGDLSVTPAPSPRHQRISRNLFDTLPQHIKVRSLGEVLFAPMEILSPTTAVIDRGTKRQLYGRHGVPCYWIVDPEARTVEAWVLVEGSYRLATRASGAEPVSLPPFSDLALIPASLWP